jgi:hypothetical protein
MVLRFQLKQSNCIYMKAWQFHLNYILLVLFVPASRGAINELKVLVLSFRTRVTISFPGLVS